MALGEPKQVQGWLMIAVGGVGQPMIDLSLRFPMFFVPSTHTRFEHTFSIVSVPMSISLGACAVKRSHGMINVPL